MKTDKQLKQAETDVVQAVPKVIEEKVKKAEDTGTAMMQTAQEFLLAVETVLRREFGWKHTDISKFEEELRLILIGANLLEHQGFSILNDADMQAVAQIARRREFREKHGRFMLPSPSLSEYRNQLTSEVSKQFRKGIK